MKITDVTVTLFAWDDIPATQYGSHAARFAGRSDLGLVEGEQVDVVSRRGRVRVAVTITDRSPEGLIFLSFHFPQHVLTNLLTTDAYDPVTETPEFKACAVRIEKAS